MKIEFDLLALKVLSPEQQSLKPFLEEFAQTHLLVGGIAIALMLGHRKSADFDLFRFESQGTGKALNQRIEKTGLKLDFGSDVFHRSEMEEPELNLILQGVEVQLRSNPFGFPIFIPAEQILCGGLPAPSLLDLAAMKFYALTYRHEWKDAVDLYWILQKTEHEFESVVERSRAIFNPWFQAETSLRRLLNNQWNTRKTIEYINKPLASNEEMGKFLQKRAEEVLKIRLN